MDKLILTKAQKRRRRILRWVTGVVITLLAVLLALALIIPRIINTDAIRSRIIAGVSEVVKGDVRYERIGMRLLPLPRISVEQISLAIPDVVEGKAHFLAVYPEILPLFSGIVRLSKLSIESPEFSVYMADVDQETEAKPSTSASRSLEGEIERILALALIHAPDMRITIKNGDLVLARTRKPDVSFQAIQGDIIFPPKGLKLEISGRSSLFNSLSFTGILDPLKLAGQGRIALSQLDLNVLLPLLGLDVPVQIIDRRIDINLDLTMDGPTNVHASVSGTLPEVTLVRENREIVLKGKQFAGSLNRDGERTQITLDNLDLDYPEVGLSGELLLASTSPRIKVSLKTAEVEIPSVRDFTMSLAGDVPTVQTIFSIVKGGQIPVITFQTQGDDAGDLGDLKNMVIKGSLQDGKISVPGTEFNLENVYGRVRIADGVLSGMDLAAGIGNSQGRNGTLRLDLNRKDVPFRLDLGIEADLMEVPPILRTYITDESFLSEMAQITGIQGRASGRLVLDSSKDPFEIAVDLDEMSLLADYGRIPHPLTIESGQFSFRNEGITIGGLAGSMGETTFTGLGLKLSMEGEPALKDLAGDFSLILDQLYPWLSETLSLEEKLHDKLTSVSGELDLSVSGLKGPVAEPAQWAFNAKGTLKDVEVESTMIGGTGRLRAGELTATQDDLTFKELTTSILDSNLDVSGNFDNYLTGFSDFSLTLTGTVGLKTEQWLMKQAKTPPDIRITAPLTLPGLQISRNRDSGMTIKGDYAFQDGPGGPVEINLNQGLLEIKNLGIVDHLSNSTVNIKFKEKAIDFHYTGNLYFSTLDDVIDWDMIPGGNIDGNLVLELLLGQTMDLSANGDLKGTDIKLPKGLGVPVTVQDLSLNASEKRINIEKALITGPWNKVLYTGKIYTSRSGLYFEGDLTTDIFDLAEVINPSDQKISTEKAAEKEKREDTLEEQKSALWDLPLRGQIRFQAEKLRLKRVDFEPVIAYISFTDDDIEIILEQANMCGISFPGIFHATPNGISLEFSISARGGEVRPTLVCMTDKRSIITGSYDLEVNIAAEGKTSELLQSAYGNLRFHAYDGHVFKSNIFTGIFGVLNLTKTYSGSIPDLEEVEQGFAYRTLTVESTLERGKINLSEGSLDSSLMMVGSEGTIDLKTMDMDLRVLVAPLRLLNRIARLPILKQIFGGQLAAIPMQITGDISKPNVQAVSAATAGGRVMDIMTNTLMLPVTLSEELVGGSGDDQNTGDSRQQPEE